jgi:hypothetical protein
MHIFLVYIKHNINIAWCMYGGKNENYLRIPELSVV